MKTGLFASMAASWRIEAGTGCVAFCVVWRVATGRGDKVAVSHLEVVTRRHAGGVADPLADDVERVAGRQFRLPARPQILKRPRPHLQARPTDDPPHVGSQVGSEVPIAGEGVHTGNATNQLKMSELLDYFKQHWPESAAIASEETIQPILCSP